MKLDVHTLDGRKSGEVALSPSVFGVEARKDILSRAVVWQLASRRLGTKKALSRSDVSGSGRKLYRQKGTGRARVSDGHTNLRRGGGVAFAPQPGRRTHALPKKLRDMALKMALSLKLADARLVILKDAALSEEHAKTKYLAQLLRKWDWNRVLLVDAADPDPNFARAGRNLSWLHVLPAAGINVHDIMRYPHLALTEGALSLVEARLI